MAWSHLKENTIPENNSIGDEMLFTLNLKGVSDPFDAGALWTRKAGSHPEIIADHNKSSDFRLKEALMNNKFSDYIQEEGRRSIEIKRTFSDVVVWISDKTWNEEKIKINYRFPILIYDLNVSHNEDFSKKNNQPMYPHDRASYALMPATFLEPGDVRIQFGTSVFIPAPDDKQKYTLKIQNTLKPGWHTLPDWNVLREKDITNLPSCIYEKQKQIMLGLEKRPMPLIMPVWFNDMTDGLVYIKIAQDGNGKDFIQFITKGKTLSGCESSYDSTKSIWTFKFLSKYKQNLENMTDKEAKDLSSDRPTGIFDSTVRTRPHLKLEALALPALIESFESWQLYFDENGKLVKDQTEINSQIEKLTVIRSTSKENNKVWCKKPKEKSDEPSARDSSVIEALKIEYIEIMIKLTDSIETAHTPLKKGDFEEVKIPSTIGFKDGSSIKFRPAQDDRYNVILVLPKEEIIASKMEKEKEINLGRGHGLNFLSFAGNLTISAQGKAAKIDPSYILGDGCSRNSCVVRLMDENLEISQKSELYPIIILDENWIKVETLPVLEGNSDHKYDISTEMRFILGPYVIRYEK